LKRHGLSKICLLRKTGEFEEVYKQGKRLYGDGFTVVFKKNSFGHNRLGISIHRHLKGAVKRNRLKRIIRESFRLNRGIYPDNADIVFAVKPGFSLTSPLAVSQAVSFLMQPKRQEDGD